MKVLLVSTGRLPASYFRRVREELAGDPDLVIDVLAWSPPREPVEGLVRRYVLVGPGRMPPVAAPPDSRSPAVAREPGGPFLPAGASVTEPPAKGKGTPHLIRDLARVRSGVRRRLLRMVPSSTRRRVRKAVQGGPSRQFWRRVRTNATVRALVGEADLVVVLDAGGIRTGWHLARRHPDRSVVFGLSAAATRVKEGVAA
jgi:hypothetical protein